MVFVAAGVVLGTGAGCPVLPLSLNDETVLTITELTPDWLMRNLPSD
jgi:hypothetical protein